MKEFFKALRVSRRLDDRRRSAARPQRDDLDSQETIDAALSDTRSLPWSNPSPQCRRRVFARIESARYAAPVRRATWWPVWQLKLAGVCAVVGAAAWAGMNPVMQGQIRLAWARLNAPAATNAPSTIATAPSQSPGEAPDDTGLDVRAFFSELPQHTDAIAAQRLDAPLRREVAALQEDANRATMFILGPLAMGDVADVESPQ